MDMKKRLLGIFLGMVMVMSLVPASIFADETGTSTCICETSCTSQSMNSDCPVCGVEGALPENCGKYIAENGAPTENAELGMNAYATALAGETHSHCICGNTGCTKIGSEGHELITWQAWDKTDSLPTEAGNYYLTQNVDLEKKTWTVSNNVNLCLNGKIITGKSEYYDVIYVNSSGSLTITDCQGGGKITHKTGLKEVHGIDNRGILTLWNGSITGNTVKGNGGGVYNEGTFNMYGGEISGNTAIGSYGGGVYNNGTFNMTGGTISGNTANINGGGVYNQYDATFTMTGGSITGNTAYNNGGGVYNYSNSCTLSGDVKITGNVKGGTITNGTLSGGTDNNFFVHTTTLSLEKIPYSLNVGTTGMESSASVGISGMANMTVIKGTTETTGFFCDDSTSYELQAVSGGLKLGYPEHKHCVCGSKSCSETQNGHTGKSTAEWKPVALLTDITADGNYYLVGNININITWTCKYNINLCLNGKTLTGATTSSETNYDVIKVEDGKTLTITDCHSGDAAGRITHKEKAGGRGIHNHGTLNLWNGIITGNGYNVKGNWQEDCYCYDGGGVYNKGTFNMYGGSITGNTAVKNTESGIWINGAGVYNAGTFTLNGGTISGNVGGYGGGVYNYNAGYSCEFIMKGGSITGNNVTGSGGGVYNSSAGTFNMSGGSITGNNAGSGDTGNYYSGGGVYNESTFNLSGKVNISGNKLGGTFADDGTLSGGTENNVYIYKDGWGYRAIQSTGLDIGASVGISGEENGTVVKGTTSTTGFFSDSDIYELVDNGSSGLKLAMQTVTIEGVKLLDKTDGDEMKAADGTYSKTYDGKAVAYSSGTYKPGTVTGVSLLYTWQKLNGGEYTDIAGNVAPSDAGSYKLLVEAKRGKAVLGSCELPFTISKADGTGSVDITGWIYGDVANSPIVKSTTNGIENISLQYKLKGAADETYKATVPSGAGSYTVKATFAETDNYKACTATKDFTISKKTITLTGATVAARTYDGKMDANVTNVSFSGLQNSETLKFNTDYEVSSAAYDSPNAGGDKKATKVSFKVTLKDTSKANNYTLENANGEQPASISKATVVGGQAVTKGNRGAQNIYKMPDGWLVDGGKVSTTVADTGNILSDLVSYAGNELTYTLKSTATESSEKATVTLTVLSDNYNDYTYVLEIGVTEKEMTTINIAGGEYTYNGSAQAPTDITVVDNKVPVEDLDITYEGTDGTTYGSSKTAPTNAGKYIMTVSVPDTNTKYTGSASYKFEIKPKTLTATVDAKNKTYDGKAAADVEVNLSGTVKSDNISLNKTGMSAVFDSEDVGDNRTVTVSGLTLNNNEAGNYVLPTTITGQASITAKTLTIENLKVADKTYDGTDKAAIDGEPTLNGVVKSDDVTDNVTLVNGEPSFSDVKVGKNIPVNFTEFKLDGTDKGNYTLTQPTNITANIIAYVSDKSEYTVNSDDWLTGDFVVTAKQGWQVSYTNTADGNWVDKLTVSQENNNGTLEFYLKNTTGGIISEKVTATYKIDKTAPTGEIRIDERNAWQEFVHTITFGTFYKDAQTVSVTAEDGGSGVKTIEYLITADDLTIGQLADKTFTSYTDSVGIEPDDKFIAYAKLTDVAGNVTYLRSDGVVLDGTAPVINGADNGKTYCEAVTLTITDEYPDTVTVNGKTATLTDDGKLTVNPAEGKQTIIATDKAGNSTSITITVNDGCTWGEWTQNEDETHTHICKFDVSHTQTGVCHGGTATCMDKAVCENCNRTYGSRNENNHTNLVHVDAKAATTSANGNKEYWYCDGCGRYFGDNESTQEIEEADTVIKKLPVIINGDNAEVTDGEKQSLSFTSDAEFADFIRVEVDGNKLDESNYTVKAGSTIVTLNADYVATLSVGEHTLGIVSQNGTATAKFTVNKKAEEPTLTPDDKTAQTDADKSPVNPVDTGDNSNMALWLMLLLASGSVIALTTYAGKKRKCNR